MTSPRHSVALLTKDGVRTLPALLDALLAQRVSGGLEIVAVDSGSTDGTADILSGRVTDLVRIQPNEFDHGLTRNLAISRTHGQLVALVVQDALPLGAEWLDTLSRPLAVDESLAGTFARQAPRANASGITRHYLTNWLAASSTGMTMQLPGGAAELDALTPMERLARCTFDNVASCIRRSVWEQHPFKATPIAEDVEWAREVLLAGYGLRFVPEAVVVHSHDRSAAYEYARTRALHERLYDLFQLQTIPTRPALARAVASSMILHLRREWRAPLRWPHVLALAVAWPLGQYVGARRGREFGGTKAPGLN